MLTIVSFRLLGRWNVLTIDIILYKGFKKKCKFISLIELISVSNKYKEELTKVEIEYIRQKILI